MAVRSATRWTLAAALAAGCVLAGGAGCAHVDQLVHVFLPRSAPVRTPPPARSPAPSFTDSEFDMEAVAAAAPAAAAATGRSASPESRAAPAAMQSRAGPVPAIDESGEALSGSAGDLELLLRVLENLVQDSIRTQESLMRLQPAGPR